MGFKVLQATESPATWWGHVEKCHSQPCQHSESLLMKQTSETWRLSQQLLKPSRFPLETSITIERLYGWFLLISLQVSLLSTCSDTDWPPQASYPVHLLIGAMSILRSKHKQKTAKGFIPWPWGWRSDIKPTQKHISQLFRDLMYF